MWVVITLAAAMLQITRTSIQHGLRHSHDAVSAAAFRFTYGAPVALVVSIIVFGPAGVARPGCGTDVVVVIIAAGVAQSLPRWLCCWRSAHVISRSARCIPRRKFLLWQPSGLSGSDQL